jgi:hypothetical protein
MVGRFARPWSLDVYFPEEFILTWADSAIPNLSADGEEDGYRALRIINFRVPDRSILQDPTVQRVIKSAKSLLKSMPLAGTDVKEVRIQYEDGEEDVIQV